MDNDELGEVSGLYKSGGNTPYRLKDPQRGMLRERILKERSIVPESYVTPQRN